MAHLPPSAARDSQPANQPDAAYDKPPESYSQPKNQAQRLARRHVPDPDGPVLVGYSQRVPVGAEQCPLATVEGSQLVGGLDLPQQGDGPRPPFDFDRL